MLYYVYPDWWMPRPVYRQQISPDKPAAKRVALARPAGMRVPVVPLRKKDDGGVGKGGGGGHHNVKALVLQQGHLKDV